MVSDPEGLTPTPREAPMQDKPEKKTPRTLRLNARDNLIVAIDSVEPGVTVQGVTATARIMRGHKMAAQSDRQGPAGPQVRPDHRLCHRGHRAGRPHPHPQLLVCRVRARLCLRPGCARGAAAAARGPRHLRRLPPRQRQGRHAQLHRHPHQRELLGLGGPLHGRGRHPLRHPRAISQRRRRRLVRARHGLRARRQGRGLRGARAHAMGLCRPSQPRRRAGGRPRLRGVPDRAAEGASTA